MGWTKIFSNISTQPHPLLISFLTAIMVEPAKLFARTFIECPCVHSHSTLFRFCCCFMRLFEGCKSCFVTIGHLLARSFTFLCFLFGLLLTLLVGETDVDFWLEWIVAIVFSSCLIAPIVIAIRVYFRYKKDKVEFLGKWGPYFPKEDPPISFTNLAILAQENGFKGDKEKEWEHKWNSYFMNPPCSTCFNKSVNYKSKVPILMKASVSVTSIDPSTRETEALVDDIEVGPKPNPYRLAITNNTVVRPKPNPYRVAVENYTVVEKPK